MPSREFPKLKNFSFGNFILASEPVMRYNTQAFPGVAQLVARVVWDHEAAGSIPVTRTIYKTADFYEESAVLLCTFSVSGSMLSAGWLALCLPDQRNQQFVPLLHLAEGDQIVLLQFGLLRRIIDAIM